MYSSVFLFVLPCFYLMGAANPERNIVIVFGAIIGRLAGAAFYGWCFIRVVQHPIFASLSVMNLLFALYYAGALGPAGRNLIRARYDLLADMLSVRSLRLGLLALAFHSVVASAQNGRVEGRVVDSAKALPVVGAIVRLMRGTTSTAGGALAGEDGRFVIVNVAEGSYRLVVSRVGYRSWTRDSLVVGSTTTNIGDIVLSAESARLEQVVVSASRTPEKMLDAPASIFTVSQQTIAERTASTVVDHLRAVPGLDVAAGGVIQSNVVARGFNSLFSGDLMLLVDNRFAFVPSLRVNVPSLIAPSSDDIDRVEVVLGPAAALYGPNAASGVSTSSRALHSNRKEPRSRSTAASAISFAPAFGTRRSLATESSRSSAPDEAAPVLQGVGPAAPFRGHLPGSRRDASSGPLSGQDCTAHTYIGEPETAISLLYRALELIDSDREPRLLVVAWHNLINDLTETGRFMEAQKLLVKARPLYKKFVQPWSRNPAKWLEGQIARGLGQQDQAEALFREAREGFLPRVARTATALVSLDLASLYVEQGRMAQLKRIAEEMVPIFFSQQIHREALGCSRLLAAGGRGRASLCRTSGGSCLFPQESAAQSGAPLPGSLGRGMPAFGRTLNPRPPSRAAAGSPRRDAPRACPARASSRSASAPAAAATSGSTRCARPTAGRTACRGPRPG